MEDEELIQKTLSNIVATQREIENSQRGIAQAIEVLQSRIKNNSKLEAWEAVRKEGEVRHREWRIKKYGTDEPSLSQIYKGKRSKVIGYDENGSVKIDIPYYTCTCPSNKSHESGCPFRIMNIRPLRPEADPKVIEKLLTKEYDGTS